MYDGIMLVVSQAHRIKMIFIHENDTKNHIYISVQYNITYVT